MLKNKKSPNYKERNFTANESINAILRALNKYAPEKENIRKYNCGYKQWFTTVYGEKASKEKRQNIILKILIVLRMIADSCIKL